jgi:hypothetical protein
MNIRLCILALGGLLILGCGDDNKTNTVNVSESQGVDVSINDPDEDDGLGSSDLLDACDECIGNPDDGVSDKTCLEEFGFDLEDCD